MISLVTMVTNIDSKLLTIVFLFLSGTDHSVKVSSNSEPSKPGHIGKFWWLQRIDANSYIGRYKRPPVKLCNIIPIEKIQMK